MADAGSGRALEPDTIFRAKSLSKPIAAATVLTLVEDGLIALDDPLAAHVPDWPFPDAGPEAAAVTIRQLLAHRAGLQLGTIGIKFAPDEDRPSLREHLADEAVLVRPPGESFLYSNPGYDLLELLVEEITGPASRPSPRDGCWNRSAWPTPASRGTGTVPRASPPGTSSTG